MSIVINGSGTVTGLDADGISSAPTNATDSTKLPLAGGNMTGSVNFTDNSQIRLGSSNDLSIYHDGSDSIINEEGTGTLVIMSNGAGIFLQKGTSETLAQFKPDAEVSLYHNNAKKIETTANGVTVTGSVDGADNLVEEVASGATAALSHDGTASATVYGVTGTHTTYLVTASANSSITNVVALVSIGTSTSTMRITNLSGSYNTTVTGSGSNIQVTCGFGSSLVYQYRVIKLRQEFIIMATKIYPLNDTEYQSITESENGNTFEVVTDIPEGAVVFSSLADYTAKTEYARKRANEYPSIADQLDDIYHNGIDAWKATIKTTKDKYPKE